MCDILPRMKKRADFYILSTNESDKKCIFTCQLIEKAYNNGLRLFVLTENDEFSRSLDEYLWDFKATSFVPHRLDSESNDAPIVIGTTLNAESQFDSLLNVSNQQPTNVDHFQRIFEVVGDDAHMQTQARERYKFYRAQGYELDSHKIGNKS